METTTIAIANQKGGVGKTTSTINLGAGLVKKGKRVLLMDLDPQGNLTTGLGYEPDDIACTMSTLLEAMTMRREMPQSLDEFIIHAQEGIDFIAADMNLEEIQTRIQAMPGLSSYLLKKIIHEMNGRYDYVLIDCPPSIGALTYNALTAADSVIIPTQSQAFSLKGTTQLYQHIQLIQAELNAKLRVMGILITMMTERSRNEREMLKGIKTVFEGRVPVFQSRIPRSVRAGESNFEGQSLFATDPEGKVAHAYVRCVKEVLEYGEAEH